MTGVQQLTTLVLVGALILVIGYDVFARLAWGPAATITFLFRIWAHAWPVVPWLVAGAMLALWGHLFWERP